MAKNPIKGKIGGIAGLAKVIRKHEKDGRLTISAPIKPWQNRQSSNLPSSSDDDFGGPDFLSADFMMKMFGSKEEDEKPEVTKSEPAIFKK